MCIRDIPSTNRYKDTQDKAEDTGAGTVTINNDAEANYYYAVTYEEHLANIEKAGLRSPDGTGAVYYTHLWTTWSRTARSSSLTSSPAA